jgi:hypothetical protein
MKQFNWKYYLDKYPDLRMNGVHTEQQALQHWIDYGEKEGRHCNIDMKQFNWKYYLYKYPDLRMNGVHTEQQALRHWINYGEKEGRNCIINITEILYCQPIFAPDLMRLNKNIDSLESINNYLKQNNINNNSINFVFGGWCINDEYWNIISSKIIEYFNVTPIRFDKNYGKAFVVNSLILKAQENINFKYILTLDSDIMFDINEPNIFERLIYSFCMSKYIRDIPVGLIALNQSIANCHLQNVYDNSFEFESNYCKEKIVYPNGHGGIAGGCLFITLEGWNLVGGYRIMGVYAGDDEYLLRDLLSKGMSIQMADTIKCIHPHETDSKYANWKGHICQRDKIIINNNNLQDKVNEADEFWRSQR